MISCEPDLRSSYVVAANIVSSYTALLITSN